MKERPILFSAPMVRAILAGTKTQTRRVVKPQPTGWAGGPGVWLPNGKPAPLVPMDDTVLPFGRAIACPYGEPGDRLWVRETWNQFDGWAGYSYAADYEGWGIGPDDDPDHVPDHAVRWKPSIHMPRSASRITLEVTGVRVERLQDISEADARAEGIDQDRADSVLQMAEAMDQREPRPFASAYQTLWEDINGTGSWDANPWVWVVEFCRVQP